MIVGHRIGFSELDVVIEQGRLQSTVLIGRLVVYLDLEIDYFEIEISTTMRDHKSLSINTLL